MRTTALVEDYLLGWVLAAVALGLLVPEVGALTRFSTPILAVMVGSVSLTLSVDRFRTVDGRGLAAALAGHLLMPVLALGLARLLALSPPLTAGLVLVGAVTPELVTPTMTELAGGDTALAATVLVLTGVGSLAFVPAVATLFLGDVAVSVRPIVEGLLLAVVGPMTVAVALRNQVPAVGRYDEYYGAISALMVVLIIGGVAGANADLVRSRADLLAGVGLAVLGLNLAGYAVGWAGSWFAARPTRIAVALSVGMRDFAVAAALVVAAGFPTAAAMPAVVFGVVEMATSAAIARVASGDLPTPSLRGVL